MPASADSIALCIPAFNAARTLPRLLQSAAAQTAPFDEIWVHDDASTDDTSAIASSFGATVIRSDKNRGCSAGKNVLLGQVKSRWVHFHDADDELFPQFVEHAKRRIAEGGFDALLMEHEQVDESTGVRMSVSDYALSSLGDDPLGFMLTHTVNNAGVYSTEFLEEVGGFEQDPAVQYNEDRAFHLRLAEAGARFASEPYLGSRFYYRPDSMSAARQARCCLDGFEITRRFHSRHPGDHLEEVGEMCWRHATCLAAHLDWEHAHAAVDLAVACGVRVPAQSSRLFGTLTRLDPKVALRLREQLIRVFKPHLRRTQSP